MLKENSLRKRHMGLLIGGLILLIAMSVSTASATSSNVVAIGDYNGGGTSSGGLPRPLPDFSAFTFATLAPGSVTLTELEKHDTVVLNMAGSSMSFCDVKKLSAQAKSDINQFVKDGGKLIIQDAECQFAGNTGVDYSWLTYPFKTNNPGATGSFGGTLTIFEENGLSKSNPADPKYINTGAITTSTDAVGDMNVVNLTTVDPNWCLDMTGTNANGKTGAVQMYARSGAGLVIYNGLDTNYIGDGVIRASGQGQLAKTWLQWLQVSNTQAELPCGVSVSFDVKLTPGTATNPIGGTHTVTAFVSNLGTPVPGIDVTFNVISGPNSGQTYKGTTNAAGIVTWTYSDTGGAGTDKITGSFTEGSGKLHTSPAVEKIWETTCTGSTCVPEFPSVALPIMSVLGIMFLMSRKKHN